MIAIGAAGLGIAWAAAASSCDDEADTTTGSSTGADHPFCGDKVVQAELGEECDDGNDADFDDCLPACKLARCGDAFVIAATEECDDANASDADVCTTGCIRARCGDGLVQKGVEACDDFNEEDGDGCRPSCAAGMGCGNGIVEVGEECDDGNHSNGDFCTNTCLNAACGDGWLDPSSEACDDGDADDTNACSNACALAAVTAPGCPGVALPMEVGATVTLTPGAGATTKVVTGSCGGDGAEVVYAVTPIDDGLLEIDLVPAAPAAGDPARNPVLHVRTTCADASSELACANRNVAGGAERLEIQALANQTYFIFADAFGADEKPGFAVTIALTSHVRGDNCFGAPVPLAANETKTLSGNTIAARADRRGLELCDSEATKEVVYELLPSASGKIFAVLTPNYDASMYVRTSCTDATSQVLCAELGDPKETETLTLDVTAGRPYYFFVDGFKGDAGSYSIDFTLSPG